jgi:hypothetical protein
MNNQHEQLRSVLQRAANSGTADEAGGGAHHAFAAAVQQGQAIRRRRTAAVGGVLAGFVLLGGVVAVNGFRTGDGGRSGEVVVADTSAPTPGPTTQPVTPVTEPKSSEVPPSGPSTTATPSTPATPVDTTAGPPAAAGPLAIAVLADGSLVSIDPLTQEQVIIDTLDFVPTKLVAGQEPGAVFIGQRRTSDNGYELIDVIRRRADGQRDVVVEGVTAFAVDTNGRMLAYTTPGPGTGDPGRPAPQIIERDLASGVERSWVHQGYELETIGELNYSPDGTQLAYSASFESAQIYVIDVESATQRSQAIEPLLAADGSQLDSFGSVDWIDNETLAVVGRCCYAEGVSPDEVFTMSLDGEVIDRLVLTGAVSVDVDPTGTWWAVTRAAGADVPTTYLTVRFPDATLVDYDQVTVMGLT